MIPGISVIVPAFNAEATLAETLTSISMQTRPPAEIIVVDDGSTDGTAGLATASGLARVLTQKNGGVAAAFNAGIAVARGDFIAFLDADDIWTRECLEMQVAAILENTSATAVVGQFEEFICPSLTSQDATRFIPRPRQTGWLSGSTLIARQVFTAHGPFNDALRQGVWIDWFGRARRNGLNVFVHDGLVMRRRLRPGTLGGNEEALKQDLLKIARASLELRRGIAGGKG